MSAVNYGAKASIPHLETTIPTQVYYDLPSVGSVTGFNRVTTQIYPLASEKQVVTSGGNTIRFRLNTQRNLWIDPTRFHLEFTLKALPGGAYVDTRCGLHGMIQNYQLSSMGQIVEDVRDYNTLSAWQLRFFGNPRTNNGVQQILTGVASEGDIISRTGHDRPLFSGGYWVNTEAPGAYVPAVVENGVVTTAAKQVGGLRPDVSAALMRGTRDHRYCIPLIGSGLFGVNSKFLPTEIFRDLDFVFTLAEANMFIKMAGNGSVVNAAYKGEYTLENVILRLDYISLPEAMNAQLLSNFTRGNRITMRLPAFSVTQQHMLLAAQQQLNHTAVITDTLSSVRAVYCLYKQSRDKEYYYVGTHYHFTEPGKSSVAALMDDSGFKWFQLQNGPAMIPNNPITNKSDLLMLVSDALAGSVQANIGLDPYEGLSNELVVSPYGDFVGYHEDDEQLLAGFNNVAEPPANALTSQSLQITTSGGKFMLACPLVAYNAGGDVLVGQRVDHDLYIHTRWNNPANRILNYQCFYILAYDRILSAGINGISTMQ